MSGPWMKKHHAKSKDQENKPVLSSPTSSLLSATKCESIKSGCESTKRILESLKYYSSLDVNNGLDRDKLTQFCNEYPTLLNDYIHILDTHSNVEDLDEIFSLLINEYEFEQCNAMNCFLLLRHYRDRNSDKHGTDLLEQKTSEHSVEFVFYRDTMDTIHCYLFHLYDTGMRIKRNENITDQQKKLIQLENGRLKSNKFTLNTTNKNSECTLMDGLLSLSDGKNLQQIFTNEEYDSDAMTEDVNSDEMKSNFARILGTAKFRQIKNYVYNAKLHKYTFATGFRFYYWQYYRDEHEEAEQDYYNQNDHGGYKEHSLWIEPKWQSIKEEVLNNKFHALKLYQFNVSMNKSHKYINTQKSKQTRRCTNAEELHYDVEQDSLSLQHILSLIIYCDQGDLQKEFTASFRKSEQFQSIEVIKQNNREFANWSRIIREAVEVFGWDGHGIKHPNDKKKRINKLRGPFFCGMSFVMAMSEFNIRLCGPTSTSKQVEIAERFATVGGMIITLDNNGYKYSHDLTAFGCAWLSNFPSEDEWLFCGGRYPVKIQSVTLQSLLMKTDFSKWFRSLYYFDCLLDGTDMSWKKRPKLSDGKNEIRDTIIELIKHNLKRKGYVNSYPKYINSTFQAFVDHKRQIVINLHFIYKYFDVLRHLIIKKNLLKPLVLQLFTNVERIIIYSTHPHGSNHEKFDFDLVSLISMINKYCTKQNNLEVIIKATHEYIKTQFVCRSWLYDAAQSIGHMNLYTRLLEKTQPDYGYGYEIKEDWLVINI